MYQVLIVDDELYSIEGVKAGVDWSSLQVDRVFEALHLASAEECLEREVIDIVICDIEMPGGSGLELLEWIKDKYPSIETILFTCHAEFHYAKQAIRLGSFDYVLGGKGLARHSLPNHSVSWTCQFHGCPTKHRVHHFGMVNW